ncbi:uncharacterized protein LOC117584314 isoform X1 [Drosophila guanche]|uniref:uncharacterized protein LOC117584314 isoform X1 n=1 Tax=Drosophila guanche TaxID=7266 RepID=UPI001471E805|nr:uncharacterized protein LOC117584314 isoform X1 [Drosophila guanche]
MRIVYCNALFALLLLQASVIIDARDCLLCHILQSGKDRRAIIPRISTNVSINGGVHIYGGFGLGSQSSDQPKANQPAREIQHESSQRTAQRSLQVEAKIEIRQFTEADIEIDGKLKTVELIKKYGFPVETHFVTTEDGYKLCLHRMPRPGAQPILLVHGLMSSSAAWVMLGPSNGLAYILYLQGYDVWMLNTRGNIYSMEHTKKFISMREYWDFSFHDIGVKDLPPTIDLILERTNYQQIQYIGHSQGSTVFFVMCSELPSYSSKVIIMQALSPSVFMKETRSPVLQFMSFFKGPLTVLLQQLGGYAVSLTTKLIDKFKHHICPANRITSKICGMFDYVLCGFNWHGFNMTIAPIILGHSSQGSSTKLIHHYAQMHTKLTLHFRRYDYGSTSNLMHYKSISPPSYNLSQTQCKVVLHHGEGDWLSSGSDVAKLQESLPNCIENRKVELKSFSHFDFIMSNDVRSLVYDRVVNVVVTNKIQRTEPLTLTQKTQKWSQVQSQKRISYQSDKSQNTQRYPDSDTPVQHMIHIKRQGALQLGRNLNKQIQYQRQTQIEISKGSDNPSENIPQSPGQALPVQPFLNPDDSVQNSIHIKRQGELQLGTNLNKQIQYQRQTQLEISKGYNNPSENIPQSPGQALPVQPFLSPDDSVQNSIHIKRQGELQLGTSNKQIQYQRQTQLEISNGSNNPSQNIPQWSQVQSDNQISFDGDKAQNPQGYPESDTTVQHTIHIKRQGELQLGTNLNKQIQYQRQTQLEISKGSDNPRENIPQSPGQALPVQPFLNPDDSVQNSIHIKRQGELQLGTSNKQIQYQRQTQLEISNGSNNPSQNIPQWSQVQSDNQISFDGDKAQNPQGYPESDTSVQHTIHIKRQGELQLGTSNKQIQYQRQTQLEISKGSNNPSENIPQSQGQALPVQPFLSPDDSVQNSIHIKRQGELQLGTSNKQIQYQRQTQLNISGDSSYNPTIQSQNRPQWSQVQSDNRISFVGDKAQNPQGYPESDTSVQHTIHIKRQGELQLGTSNKQIQYQRQTQLEISNGSNNPSQNIPQWSQVQSDNQISFDGDKAQNPQGYPESDTSVQHTIHIKRQGELQLGTSNKQIQYQRQTQLEISKGSNNPSENIPQSQGQALPVQPFLSPDDSVQNSIHIKRQGELQLGTSNKQIQYQRQTQLNISGDSSYNPTIQSQNRPQWSQVQSDNRISFVGDKAQNPQGYPESDTSVQHTIHIKRQGELQLGTSNKQIQYQRQTQLEISKGSNNPSENIPQSPGQALPVQPFLSPDDSVQNSIHIKRQGELQLGTSNKQIQYQRQTQLNISGDSSYNPTIQSQNRPQWSQVQSDNRISFVGDKAQNPQGYPESDTSVQHTIHIKRQGELQLGTSNKQIQYQRQTQLEISKGSNNPSENIPQSQGQALPVQPFLSPDDSVQNSIHIKRQGELQLGTSNKQIQYQRQTQLNISGDSSYNPVIEIQNIPQWSQVQFQDIQPNRNSDNSVQNSIRMEKQIQINHFTDTDIESNGQLKTDELIRKYGFPVETHFVTTEDGYKLCLHRMPRPGAQPILLVHGLMSSSAAWVMLGPSNGLAYILYLQGYDVWMLNTRGNIYSREHTKKFISMKEYWDFSFHEIGVKDLPPSIDFILERTNYQKIQYIGHSQGSTVFFVMCSELPSYSIKVNIMQALSPSVFMKETRSPVLKFMSFFRGPLSTLLVKLGGYAVSLTTKLIQQFRHHICPANRITSKICGMFDFVLCGFNWHGFNMTLTPIIVGHSSQGSSTKQIHHYAQLQKKLSFHRYDFGPTRNLIHYKSLFPPSYNLSQTQCKVVLHHGEDDWLASGSDVANLQESLPNCIENRKVELKSFSHFDFIMSNDVRSLVYDRVVNLAVTNN